MEQKRKRWSKVDWDNAVCGTIINPELNGYGSGRPKHISVSQIGYDLFKDDISQYRKTQIKETIYRLAKKRHAFVICKDYGHGEFLIHWGSCGVTGWAE